MYSFFAPICHFRLIYFEKVNLSKSDNVVGLKATSSPSFKFLMQFAMFYLMAKRMVSAFDAFPIYLRILLRLRIVAASYFTLSSFLFNLIVGGLFQQFWTGTLSKHRSKGSSVISHPWNHLRWLEHKNFLKRPQDLYFDKNRYECPPYDHKWCRLTNPRAQCPHKMKITSVLCWPYFTPAHSSLCLGPTEVLNGNCIHIDVIYHR